MPYPYLTHRRCLPHSISLGGLRTPAPVSAAPPSWGRHPQTFTRADIAHHSITSSAWASSDGGTVSPSALAVLRLITSSNFVGCTIGRLAGFSPLRTRPA